MQTAVWIYQVGLWSLAAFLFVLRRLGEPEVRWALFANVSR